MRVLKLFLGALALVACLLAVTVPLDLRAQGLFALATVVAAAILGRNKSRQVTIALCILSLIASTRYIYWRITETLHFATITETLLGTGLFLAELYAWLILVLGYIQTTWPLHRPVEPMKGDPSTWPTVDVYVPTYNESLQIVQDTVLAALNMDYPRDRFRVYLLDDGRRPEFRAFAEAAGAIYMTRPDNKHAKAGNMNHALTKTDGELILVFDADHIPTRAFLQMTVGWFQKDPKLCLLQTPHHFYSPDPVQRNLLTVKEVPDEGALFYGSVQPGNDFWNAAFFCGSCAVIRREALMITNGFAGETVTEDAHTALKLQRMGWSTAYLDIRLASGLATERLALHVGQRARWARGMTQIFRIDNPLLGPGLTWGQRLCYLNAMMHFQFPLPRIVFLTSPLAYLLFGANIIYASAAMIAVYAAPHLIHSIMTNNRIQGEDRRAFWGEVYETLLAFHLLAPTVLTIFDPKKGKFNVTEKGGLLEHGYFDYRLMWPHITVVFLLVAGVSSGFARLFWPERFDVQLGTLLLNTAWSMFSVLILLTALAVGRETRQVRNFVRVDAVLPVILRFADGLAVESETTDVSMGGLSVKWPAGLDIAGRELTGVDLLCGARMVSFPAAIISGEDAIRVQFQAMPLGKRRALVTAVMGRADAWQPHGSTPSANPFASFADLCRASASLLFWWRLKDLEARVRGRVLVERSMRTGAIAGAAILAAATFAPSAKAQAPAAPTAETTVASAPAAPASSGGVRQVVYTLKDMGVAQPLRLRGTDGQAGIPFDLRTDEVAVAATLTINFAYSPVMLPDLSQLTVAINDEVIGSVVLPRETANNLTVQMPVNPALFLPKNRLNLRFAGHYTRGCEDPLHSSLWANISNIRTTLAVTFQRLPAQPDLARLPSPFYEAGVGGLTLPFVFAGNPSDGAIQAAAGAASYFGLAAGYRGFRFPVQIGGLPSGEGVIFATSGQQIPGLFLPTINGPTLAVVPNPNDPTSSLLLVMGRNDAELRQAGQNLAVGSVGLKGAYAQVGAPRLRDRVPYDAPRWVRMDRPVRFGEMVDQQKLQALGLTPAPLQVDFRVAPDLFLWPTGGAPLRLRYRFPEGSWIDLRNSRLDVSLNGQYLRSLHTDGRGAGAHFLDRVPGFFTQKEQSLALPPYLLSGPGQMGFFFDLKSNKLGECKGELPTNVRSGIDPDSTIDLTGGHHFTSMPNLAYFVSSGFPFTRMADLSDTALLISAQPTAQELEAIMSLVGRFADSTGAPATKLSITRGADRGALNGKDVLVVGPVSMAASNPELFGDAPFVTEGSRLRLRVSSVIARAFSVFNANLEGGERKKADEVLVSQSGFTGVVSFPSPYGKDKVVVAILSDQRESLPGLVAKLSDPTENFKVQGDLTADTEQGLSSFRIGPIFWTGDLPYPLRLLWWLTRNPWLLALALVGAAIIMSGPIFLAYKLMEHRRNTRTEAP